MTKFSFSTAKKMTEEVLKIAHKKPMIKLPMACIFANQFSEIELLECLFHQVVDTKEHPNGVEYDKNIFQILFRIIDGKLLINGKLDAYAWKISKVCKQKNKRPIGPHTVNGMLTYADVVATIKSESEREKFTKILRTWPLDMTYAHVEAEERTVIEVTEEIIQFLLEMYNVAAVPNSYDIEYPAVGADSVELTFIKVGDALVIEQCSFGPAFYVVQKEEYELTHVSADEYKLN